MPLAVQQRPREPHKRPSQAAAIDRQRASREFGRRITRCQECGHGQVLGRQPLASPIEPGVLVLSQPRARSSVGNPLRPAFTFCSLRGNFCPMAADRSDLVHLRRIDPGGTLPCSRSQLLQQVHRPRDPDPEAGCDIPEVPCIAGDEGIGAAIDRRLRHQLVVGSRSCGRYRICTATGSIATASTPSTRATSARLSFETSRCSGPFSASSYPRNKLGVASGVKRPPLTACRRTQLAPLRLREAAVRTDVSRTTLSTTKREYPIGGHARGVPVRLPRGAGRVGLSAEQALLGSIRTLPEPRWAGLSPRSRSFARAR